MHDYGEGEGGGPLVEIGKEVFLQSHSVHPRLPPPPSAGGSTSHQIPNFQKGGTFVNKESKNLGTFKR